MQQSDYGWLAVLGVIVVVEVAGAGNEQMLSDATARWKTTHPVITVGGVLVTAAHLIHALPDEVDPFHQAFKALRLFRRQKIHAATPAKSTAINGT